MIYIRQMFYKCIMQLLSHTKPIFMEVKCNSWLTAKNVDKTNITMLLFMKFD